MSAPRLEILLARLYTDAVARREFLADPRGVAASAGLDPAQVDALAAIDRVGLELAARSFEKKRGARAPRRPVWKRLLAAVRQGVKP